MNQAINTRRKRLLPNFSGKSKRLLFCLLLLALGYIPGKAQLVNIEDQRQQLDTTGWFGQIDVSGGLTEYLSSIARLNASVRADYAAANDRWIILGSYHLLQSNSNNILHDWFGHLRYGRSINSKLDWEAFVQTQYNEQLRLKLRQLIGTGPRFTVTEKEKLSAYLGLLYMYEYDAFIESETTFYDHRLSTYFSFQWRPTEIFSLSSTTYYQPLLEDFASSRVATVTNLSFRLSNHFSFQTGISATYDALLAKAVEVVPRTTYTWSNGLRLSF